MPTYAYACTECDHRFEVVQSFSDDSLTVCPECGGRLRKVFNAVGIVFKGGGFYRTDSRDSSTSGTKTSSGGGSGSSDGGSSTSEGSGAAASTSSSGSSSSSSSGSGASGGSSTGASSPAAPSTASA